MLVFLMLSTKIKRRLWKIMELLQVQAEGEDGSKFTLRYDNDEEANALFGRGHGFNTNDRTVSRRHVSFQINSESEPRVSFQVIGKNPIWVWSTNSDATLTIFRKFEKGQLQFGDRFCLSGKLPVWFNLKKIELQEGTENDEDIDVSGIDVVKEFGFLVMGHEFDRYPKSMITNVKDWEWFLEEPSKDSENEEDYRKERREMKRKRKKGKDNAEDDEWTGESEDDKDIVAKIRKGKRPGYSTRSKDCKGPNRDTKGSINSKRKKATSVNETVENEEKDDDDNDETLGGFIVDDEDDQEEEENFEEEEEFEEEDDDDVDGVED